MDSVGMRPNSYFLTRQHRSPKTKLPGPTIMNLSKYNTTKLTVLYSLISEKNNASWRMSNNLNILCIAICSFRQAASTALTTELPGITKTSLHWAASPPHPNLIWSVNSITKISLHPMPSPPNCSASPKPFCINLHHNLILTLSDQFTASPESVCVRSATTTQLHGVIKTRLL